jgi:DNA-binding FadR family transcriptional regulator
MAARVAQELQDEIVGKRWPVGEVLGSESQLMARFGASRSVVREALRILESRLVARPKPGRGGGLVVTAPDSATITDLTRLFVDYRGLEPADLFESWAAIEVYVVDRLARDITAEGIADLRSALEEMRVTPFLKPVSRSVHRELGRLSGNPIVDVMIRVFVELVYAYGAGIEPEQKESLLSQHSALIDALEVGDGEAAAALVREIFQGMQEKDLIRQDGAYPQAAGS